MKRLTIAFVFSLLLILPLIPLYSHAQVDHLQEFNALKLELPKAGSDSKIDLLLRISFHGAKVHVDSAVTYAQQALELFQDSPNDPRKADVLCQLSESYLVLCQYAKADSLAQEALRFAPDQSPSQARCYRSISAIAARAPNAERSIHYSQLSQELFDSLGMMEEALRSRLIALPVMQDRHPVQAIDEILEALDVTDSLGATELHHVYLFELSQLDLRYSNYQEASRICHLLIAYFKKTNNRYMLARQYHNLGIIEAQDSIHDPYAIMTMAADNFGELKDYYRQALTHMRMGVSDITQDRKTKFEHLLIAKGLSERYDMEVPQLSLFMSWQIARRGYLDSAIALATETYERAPLWGQRHHAFQAAKNLGFYYNATGDYQKAYEFRKEYDLIKEATQAPENNVIVGRLEARIAGERLLEEQKLVAEQEAAIKDAQLDREKFIRNLFFVGMLLLLILLAAFGFGYQRLRNSKRIIEEQKAGLERMDQLNREVFSVIAHDFKGPLLSLSMLANQIGNRDLSQKEMQISAIELQTELKQCTLMLENLLNWARAELKIGTLPPTQSRPREICEEVLQELKALATEKNLNIVNLIPYENKENLQPDILRIVFRNLLSNAIKFSKADQSVEVGYAESGNAYFVKDQGVGIAPEAQKDLLQRAVIPELGTEYESGFGMGLYITNELLRKSGWNLDYESSQSIGTTFLFNEILN